MTKKEYPTLDNPANAAFLRLVKKDKAINVGTVAVDSGRIAIGDCETIQHTIETTTGDGLYPIWYGEKYIVIEIDMLNIMELDKEFEAAVTAEHKE